MTQTNNQQNNLLAAVAIPRVSLEMQVENYSREAQEFFLNQLGKQKGFYLADVIQDDGYSGADFSRPSIQQALKLIRDGKVQAIVWASVDRFARDVEGGLALVKLFLKAGAKVLIGQLGWYEDTPQYKWQLTNWLAMAQFQKDDIALKSKAGVDRKIARNLAHGGGSPFGYRFMAGWELAKEAREAGQPVPTKPQNVHRPVPADIATVHLMGDLALEGRTLAGICLELMSRGIKAPAGGPTWNQFSVKKILTNPCYYTGIWHYGKTYCVEPKTRRPGSKRHKVRTLEILKPESEWKPQPLPGGPIMSESRWLAIQESRKRIKAVKVGRPSKDDKVPMLRGITRCRCGTAVIIRHMYTGKKHHRYYRCSNQERLENRGRSICEFAKHVVADDLEEACWTGLMDALEFHLPALLAEHNKALLADVDGAELSTLEEKDSWLSKKIGALTVKAAMADDEVVVAALENQVKDLKEQQVQIRRRLMFARNASHTAKVDFPSLRRRAQEGRKTKDPIRRQAIFHALVESVVYADKEAELTLRVPLSAVNSQRDEHAVDNLISLKTKVLVA